MIPPNDDVIVRVPGGPAQFSEHGFAVDYEVEFGVDHGRAREERAGARTPSTTSSATPCSTTSGSRSVQFHNGQR